ncbi:hypothetical protein ASZ90_005052 [hydrocarbon metagenome]|uniref:Outer membrane protein beta-barrel domain-containing protein n=1 Tax=hydrocarbon metagenome TaxID=938273 RepID=A0A0W8FWE7_9ZZZZ
MKKYLYIVFMISLSYGQDLSFGLRFEPTLFVTEQANDNSVSFTPYSLYLSAKYSPIEWLSLEIRPGYIWGGDYGGFDLGGFAWINNAFLSNFYFIAGINNHSNEIGNTHHGSGNYIKKMLFTGIGFGYKKDKVLSIDLMYYWTNDKDFAYTTTNTSEGIPKFINKKMNAILKLGFSFYFELL